MSSAPGGSTDHRRRAPRRRHRRQRLVPADPCLGRGEGGLDPREPRLVRRGRPGGRRPRPVPHGSPHESLPGLPARGPGHRLGSATPRTQSPTPLLEHLRRRKALLGQDGAARRGPALEGPNVKDAIAAGARASAVRRPGRRDVEHRERRRRRSASRRAGRGRSSGAGFGDFQPRYVFQVPARRPHASTRCSAGFNQLWRRNIRKAQKSGVEVTLGDASDLAGLPRGVRRDGSA